MKHEKKIDCQTKIESMDQKTLSAGEFYRHDVFLSFSDDSQFQGKYGIFHSFIVHENEHFQEQIIHFLKGLL